MDTRKKKSYFLPGADRRKVQLSEEAKYSLTHWRDGQEINKHIINIIKESKRFRKSCQLNILKNVRIIDGTSCVGGNTVLFAKEFKDVVAVDINKDHINMLKQNLDLYNFDTKVEYHCLDITSSYKSLLHKTKYNVLFIDPPWGGPEYKNEDSIELYLSNISITELSKIFLQNVDMLVIKIPSNYNRDHYIREINKEKSDIRVEIIELYKYPCIFIYFKKIKISF